TSTVLELSSSPRSVTVMGRLVRMTVAVISDNWPLSLKNHHLTPQAEAATMAVARIDIDARRRKRRGFFRFANALKRGLDRLWVGESAGGAGWSNRSATVCGGLGGSIV